MQIEIIEAGKPYKDGKYFKMALKYNRDGKDQERKLVAVGDSKDTFNILKDAQPGEVYEIEIKKDGDFYNWVGAVKTDAKPAVSTARAAKSTFETPEERATRQLHIARQSSLAQAVAYSAYANPKATVAEILKTAQTFVDFVYQIEDLEEEGEVF